MRYYVEFHGEEVEEEIGTVVEANDPDHAVEVARDQVKRDWDITLDDGTLALRRDDESIYDFMTKYRVDRIELRPYD